MPRNVMGATEMLLLWSPRRNRIGIINVMHFHGNVSVRFGLKSSYFALVWGKVPGDISEPEDEGSTISWVLLHYDMQLGPRDKNSK